MGMFRVPLSFLSSFPRSWLSITEYNLPPNF